MEQESLPEAMEININADGLASIHNLIHDKGKTEVMRWISAWLKATPEFETVSPALIVQHIFGEGNLMADAASRGYFTLIYSMCCELGSHATAVQVPQDLRDMVEQARCFASRTEQERNSQTQREMTHLLNSEDQLASAIAAVANTLTSISVEELLL